MSSRPPEAPVTPDSPPTTPDSIAPSTISYRPPAAGTPEATIDSFKMIILAALSLTAVAAATYKISETDHQLAKKGTCEAVVKHCGGPALPPRDLERCLTNHVPSINKIRKVHGAPPLTCDKE